MRTRCPASRRPIRDIFKILRQPHDRPDQHAATIERCEAENV
jgi:hypothetical protein